jgi:hypothetical protein
MEEILPETADTQSSARLMKIMAKQATNRVSTVSYLMVNILRLEGKL